MRKILALLICLFATSAPSFAQSTLTGFPSFNSFQSGVVDSVNDGNLNVHITIPLVTKRGVGMPFVASFAIDSTIWTESRGGAVVSIGSRIGGFQFLTNIGHLSIISAPSGKCLDYEAAFTGPNNGTHQFGVVLGPSEGGCQTTATVGATDGSGYVLNANYPNNSWLVTDTSGKVYNAVVDSSGSVADPNGNTVSFTTSGTTTSYSDTLGKNVLTVSTGPPDTYAYTGGDGSQQFTVTYTGYTVKTDFAPSCSNIATDFDAAGLSLPTQIALPNGSGSYTITYEQTPGQPSGTTTGRIASITLPTGGTISYTYNSTSCNDLTATSLTRTFKPNTAGEASEIWNYVRNGSDGNDTTTVTDPAGNQQVITFQSYSEVDRKAYAGASSGTPLEEVVHCYNYTSAAPCSTQTGYDGFSPPLALTKITYLNGSSSGSQTVTYFSTAAPGISEVQLNIPTEVDSYDFNGSLLRKVGTGRTQLPEPTTRRIARSTRPKVDGSRPIQPGSAPSIRRIRRLGTDMHISPTTRWARPTHWVFGRMHGPADCGRIPCAPQSASVSWTTALRCRPVSPNSRV